LASPAVGACALVLPANTAVPARTCRRTAATVVCVTTPAPWISPALGVRVSAAMRPYRCAAVLYLLDVLPHTPQLLLSVCKSLQVPLHSDRDASLQTHVPPLLALPHTTVAPVRLQALTGATAQRLPRRAPRRRHALPGTAHLAPRALGTTRPALVAEKNV
jgi:hypothetical protein